MNGMSEGPGEPRPDQARPGASVEGSLRKSSDQLRAVVDLIPIPMTINRREDGKILHANWRAESAFGLPRGGAAGRSSVEFYFDPADRKAAMAAIERNGRLRDFEVHTRKADGTPFWVAVSMEAATFDGEAAVLAAFYDITERKAAEEALKESERLFRTLAETVAAGITIVQDGVLRYVNPTVTRLMGYTAEEMIGRPPWDFVHPQMREETQRRSLQREQGADEPTRFEMRVLTKDGHELWVDQSVAIIEYDGRYATMGAALDVTRRKQMEAQLRETEERYRTLVENVEIGISLIDKDHTVLMSNTALGRMMRKPVSELVAKKCYAEFEQRTVVCPDCPGSVALRTGQPAEQDRKGLREDGSSFDVRIHAFPLFESDGSPVGFVEVVEDVTVRKRAEQAIVESEAKYRTLVEQLPAIIYTTPSNPGPGTDYISPYVEKVLGYSPLDFTQNPNMWRNRIHPDDRERALAALEDSFANGGPYASEYRMVARDGRIVWFRDEARLVRDESGDPLFLQGVMVDMTERKRAEEELRVGRQKLADVIESTHVGTWEWNVQTGITMFSDRWAEIAGYTLEELQSSSFQGWLDLVHPDDLSKSDALLQKHFTGELTYYDCKCRLKHKNGSWVWIHDRGRLVERTNDGKPLRMMGTRSDITARKRAERAILESEAKYRTLVEQIPAIVYTSPPQKPSATSYVNPYVETVLGYAPLEYERADLWRERLHPEDRDRVLAELSESLARSGTFASEYRMLARDGRTVWFRDEAVIVRDEGGTPLCLQGVMLDITRRKQMEEESRDQEERFRTVVNSSKDAMVAIDDRGLITVFNPAAATMFGRSWSDCIGQSLDLLIPVAYQRRHAGYVKDFFERGQARGIMGKTIEVVALRSNGEVFPVELSLSSGRWGDKPFVLATMRDITERRKIETELRKFKTISDRSPHGHAIFDLDGNVLYVNAAFARMHGYEPEEFACKHLSDFHTPEQMPEVERLIGQLRREGRYVSEEVWHKRRDGTVFPTLMDAAVITDEKGTPMFLSGMAADISERKAVEAALRRQALVFDNINDGVIITDAEGRITDWNPGAERMFDYFKHEVIGEHAEMLNKPEDAEAVTASIHEGLRRDGYWCSEVAFVRKDGTEGVSEVFLVPIRDEHHRIIGRIAVNRDITARKRSEEEKARLEAQLHQAQKMEAVGTLAGGVAHDFNNLLTAIFGYTDLAKYSLPGDHPAVQSLEMVEQAGRQARGVINSLLTFSQKDTPAKAPVNLAVSLAQTIQLLRRLLPASIDIEEDMPAGPEVWVNADGTQLQQVWMNLAVNARDAMPRGGRLRVSLRAPGLGSEAGKSGSGRPAAAVVIEDTGVGMSDEIKARMFEPFFSTKPRGQGTGLGLSVTHAIVTNHKGQIEIESQKGRGTRVTISLPRCDPPCKRDRKTAVAGRSTGRGELILVVEDNEHVRSILASSLRSQGYRVIAAADSVEAKALLHEHSRALSLILLDLDLPKTSGTALLRTMRRALPDVPILIVTGSVSPKVKEHPERKQFLLRKPLEISELDGYVTRLLDRSSGSGENHP